MHDIALRQQLQDHFILDDMRRYAKENRRVTARLLDAALQSGMPGTRRLPVADPLVFRKILRVKLFQEYVLAVEEAGALCVAVRERHKGGVFFRYCNCEVKDVRDFFREVDDNPSANLATLLALPPEDEMRAELTTEDAEATLDHVGTVTAYIQNTATEYLHDHQAQARAMNKAKHGFTILENLGVLNSRLGTAPPREVNIISDISFPEYTPDGQSRIESRTLNLVSGESPEVERIEVLYSLQEWIFAVWSLLHNRGVDLTNVPPNHA